MAGGGIEGRGRGSRGRGTVGVWEGGGSGHLLLGRRGKREASRMIRFKM